MTGNATFFWVCSGYLYEVRQYLERAIGPAAAARSGTWVQGPVEPGADADPAGRAGSGARDGRPLPARRHRRPGPRRAGPGRVQGRPAAPAGRASPRRRERRRRDGTRARRRRCGAAEHADRAVPPRARLRTHRLRPAGRGPAGGTGTPRRLRDVGRALDALPRRTPAGPHRLPGAAGARRHAFGAAARLRRTVGHPPCGTPEMASLRDKCEDRLVRSLGKRRYERTFRRAATSDARSLVAWGASGGPAPGSEPAVLDRVLPPHCVEPCGPLLFGFA